MSYPRLKSWVDGFEWKVFGLKQGVLISIRILDILDPANFGYVDKWLRELVLDKKKLLNLQPFLLF